MRIRHQSSIPQDTPSRLLKQFSQTIENESRRAIFTCGGRIPILLKPHKDSAGNLTPKTAERVQGQTATTQRVTVRWGPNGSGKVLTLPQANNEDQASLEQLVQDCTPATFGRDGRDVYDENYRRAGAMSADKFMTDFCPYEAGIIDVVTQLLLPAVTGDLEKQPPRSKIAEKYDLTPDQESEIWYAIHKLARQEEDLIYTADIKLCFDGLQVTPATTEEMLGIVGKLDPLGSGYTVRDEFMDVAAARLASKTAKPKPQGQFEALSPASKAKRMMNRGIRAELYKLNVYSGPGGHFKPHVDTPRSASQIESLVVCLPVGFQGGELIIRHCGQEVLHDWSTQASSVNKPAIQWAAFYSDCEHEVLNVTAGQRVTLTYNLFLSSGTGMLGGRPLSLEPNKLPLALEAKRLLNNKSFMRSGGFLGIHLAHRYPHTHPIDHALVPSMLKGIDMAVYDSFFAAGLRCKLVPHESSKDDAYAPDSMLEDSSPRRSHLHTVKSELKEMLIDHNEHESDFEEEYDSGDGEFDIDSDDTQDSKTKRRRNYEKRPIVWLNEKKHTELSAAYLTVSQMCTI